MAHSAAERRQAGRERAKFPCSGPVGHHLADDRAEAAFPSNAGRRAGRFRRFVAGRRPWMRGPPRRCGRSRPEGVSPPRPSSGSMAALSPVARARGLAAGTCRVWPCGAARASRPPAPAPGLPERLEQPGDVGTHPSQRLRSSTTGLRYCAPCTGTALSRFADAGCDADLPRCPARRAPLSALDGDDLEPGEMARCECGSPRSNDQNERTSRVISFAPRSDLRSRVSSSR